MPGKKRGRCCIRDLLILLKRKDLASDYRERAGEALPRADELVSSLTTVREIHDRITRTLTRLQTPWPAVDRNMIAESHAALNRGESENVTELLKRLENGGLLGSLTYLSRPYSEGKPIAFHGRPTR